MARQELPADLEAALDAHPAAKAAWAKQTPSHRHEYLESIEAAKRADTRRQRIAKVVETLAEGGGRMAQPSTRPLPERLGIKPGMTLVVLNPPPEANALLDPLPEGASVAARFRQAADAVLCFVSDRAEFERRVPGFIDRVRPDALLWIAYPKQRGRVKSDLTRDVLNELMSPYGWQGVAQVSVDGTWSASRFRPAS